MERTSDREVCHQTLVKVIQHLEDQAAWQATAMPTRRLPAIVRLQHLLHRHHLRLPLLTVGIHQLLLQCQCMEEHQHRYRHRCLRHMADSSNSSLLRGHLEDNPNSHLLISTECLRSLLQISMETSMECHPSRPQISLVNSNPQISLDPRLL